MEWNFGVTPLTKTPRSATPNEAADALKTRLEGLAVKITARAGESGRLFGAITPQEIADAVKAAGGPDVDRRRIQIGAPIKTVGTHLVAIGVHSEVSATVSLEIAAS